MTEQEELQALREEVAQLKEAVAALERSNVLWGKKWISCGDSLTEGDYRNAPNDDWKIPGTERGRKTYPYFIGQRNHMTVINEALCGSIMPLSQEYQEDPANNPINTRRPFMLDRYKKIPADTDYLTLWFGNNDSRHAILGSIEDETINTYYGAFNVLLPYLMENYPTMKIGIIVTYGGTPDFRQATRDVAYKWGIPTLDLERDPQVPFIFRDGETFIDSRAVKLHRRFFNVAEDNGHPNLIAHEYLSTIVEAFLRRL